MARAQPKPRTVFSTVNRNTTTVHDTGTETQEFSLINNSSSDEDMDFSTSLPETSSKVRNIYILKLFDTILCTSVAWYSGKGWDFLKMIVKIQTVTLK